MSLKEPERTTPMLRGRSDSDSVLPRGEAPYSSSEASWVGMLLDRVILGGPPTGLGTTKKTERLMFWVLKLKEKKKATSVHEYSPIHVLEVRGREVGEDSGRVSESVTVRIAWECLLSPFSFTSSSTCEAPLKVHEYNKRLENLCRAKVFVPTWLQILILRGLNGGLEYCQAEWGLKQPIIHYQWDLCLSAAKGLGLNCINLIDKTLRVGVCVCAFSYLKPFFGSVFLSLWELRRLNNVII